jgi:hypothetical protein
MAVAFGEVGHHVDLIGRRVAGDLADRLQADVDDRMARTLVRLDVLVDPDCEIGIAAVDLVGRIGCECGFAEEGGDPRELGGGRIDAERLYEGKFLLDLAGIFGGAATISTRRGSRS